MLLYLQLGAHRDVMQICSNKARGCLLPGVSPDLDPAHCEGC